MRKISEEAARAFYDGRHYKKDNTEVRILDSGVRQLTLFENVIAKWNPNDRDESCRSRVLFNMCGWNTMTTRDRLNALGIKIRSRQGVPYWETNGIRHRIATGLTYYHCLTPVQAQQQDYWRAEPWPNADLRKVEE